ncbi:MAG: hypothetical protein PHH47_01210 [Gallionella sp.]|nr:hypothetical protein [Gallionella sp.]MDD4946144.1 hypothetical protein [Gallionella sp.]
MNEFASGALDDSVQGVVAIIGSFEKDMTADFAEPLVSAEEGR